MKSLQRTICMLVACGVPLLSHAAGPSPAHRLNLPPETYAMESAYFTVIEGHDTTRGAIEAWGKLKDNHPDLSLSVFPIAGDRNLYKIVAASYVPKGDAALQSITLRGLGFHSAHVDQIGIKADMEKLPGPLRGTWSGPQTRKHLHPPRPGTDLYFVVLGEAKLTKDQAEQALAKLRSRVPELLVGIYQDQLASKVEPGCQLLDSLEETAKEDPETRDAISGVPAPVRQRCGSQATYTLALAGYATRAAADEALRAAHTYGLHSSARLFSVQQLPLSRPRLLPVLASASELAERVRQCAGLQDTTLEALLVCARVPQDDATLARKAQQCLKSHRSITSAVAECIAITLDDDSMAARVKSCLASGRTSVFEMADCSGHIMSSNTLTRCILGSDCKAIPLPLEVDRRALAKYLEDLGIDPNAPVQVQPRSLNAMADVNALKARLEACRKLEKEIKDAAAKEKKEAQLFEAQRCYSSIALSEGEIKQFECVRTASDEKARTECLLTGMPTDKRAQLECLLEVRNDPLAMRGCVGSQADRENALKFAKCVGGAPTQSAYYTECLAPFLPVSDAERISCLSKSSELRHVVTCVAGKDTERTLEILKCGENRKNAEECLLKMLPSDAGRIAECTKRWREDWGSLAACAAGREADLAKATTAAACLSNAKTNSERMACALPYADKKTQQTVSCMTKAADRAGVGKCLLQGVLPESVGNAPACALTSSGYLDFALCVSGPQMNEESRIAAQCAIESGGEPISSATCTAGKLTIRELMKCLGGTIGKDCFGPGNTLVVTLRAFADFVDDVARVFSEGLRAFATQVQNVFVRAGEDFRRSDIGRSDIGKVLCGWLGC